MTGPSAVAFLDALRTLFFPPPKPAIDPDDFAEGIAARLRLALPGAAVAIVARLSITADADDGFRQMVLHGLHDAACRTYDGAAREALLAAWVEAAATPALEGASLDDIVPVLKPADWAQLDPPAAGPSGAPPWEALAPGLVVTYALDTPRHVAFVGAHAFHRLGLGPDAATRRRRAVANLRGKLPGLEVQRFGGVNLVIAGGFHEASVLLFDDFWERECGRLRGDPAVALPSGDVLMFCDGTEARALDELRRQAADIHADAAYALSPRVFRRSRDGGLVPLDP